MTLEFVFSWIDTPRPVIIRFREPYGNLWIYKKINAWRKIWTYKKHQVIYIHWLAIAIPNQWILNNYVGRYIYFLFTYFACLYYVFWGCLNCRLEFYTQICFDSNGVETARKSWRLIWVNCLISAFFVNLLFLLLVGPRGYLTSRCSTAFIYTFCFND